jgi:hypothetical protein
MVAMYEWLSGTETEGATVLDLGAYCVVTNTAGKLTTDWSTTPPEVSGATLWPGEMERAYGDIQGTLLLPSAGSYLVTSGWNPTGDQQKVFYWLTWPGAICGIRWWRVIA